jgi:hypothetical protein
MTSKPDKLDDGVQRTRVLMARSAGDVALLIGCAMPETLRTVAGISISHNPESKGAVNRWASALLSREIRGDVVVLMVEA